MCLRLPENYKLETAEEDFIVYKFLINSVNGKLKTPYQKKTIRIGRFYDSRLEVTPSTVNKRHSYDYPNASAVEIGIHSYIKYEDAYDMVRGYANRFAVVECTVPKGSNFYRGFHGNLESVASDCIHYDKIIEHPKTAWFPNL